MSWTWYILARCVNTTTIVYWSVINACVYLQALSNETQLPTNFQAIFKASIAREAMTKVSCQGCRSLTSARVRRELTGAQLPPVLAVNTAVHTQDHVEMWLDKQTVNGPERFLQPAFAISQSGDRIIPLTKDAIADRQDLCVYELRAMVVQIQAEDDPAHLVSLVKGKHSCANPESLTYTCLAQLKKIKKPQAIGTSSMISSSSQSGRTKLSASQRAGRCVYILRSAQQNNSNCLRFLSDPRHSLLSAHGREGRAQFLSTGGPARSLHSDR